MMVMLDCMKGLLVNNLDLSDCMMDLLENMMVKSDYTLDLLESMMDLSVNTLVMLESIQDLLENNQEKSDCIQVMLVNILERLESILVKLVQENTLDLFGMEFSSMESTHHHSLVMEQEERIVHSHKEYLACLGIFLENRDMVSSIHYVRDTFVVFPKPPK